MFITMFMRQLVRVKCFATYRVCVPVHVACVYFTSVTFDASEEFVVVGTMRYAEHQFGRFLKVGHVLVEP